ncbi:DUF2934 domain-containing protein [Tardiphaga alba]|jgi:hypothetical protein|uniref:DUF2934 domain-containing protein n=1 Tax=Tardiphaga alba TaxID=340268 RepID=A0ABX8AE12_9BRAD|nr:DUF2934 domain-containing protein [Tardiphaga alba]QUS41993.1 DUF2934 domain-containing protein [Tardiphaga alba]
MQDIENSIRERAYHLWDDAGRPDGQADNFWLIAQHQLLEASLDQLVAVAKVSKKPRAVKKPASTKKTKAA